MSEILKTRITSIIKGTLRILNSFDKEDRIDYESTVYIIYFLLSYLLYILSNILTHMYSNPQ